MLLKEIFEQLLGDHQHLIKHPNKSGYSIRRENDYGLLWRPFESRQHEESSSHTINVYFGKAFFSNFQIGQSYPTTDT